ncbi:hypothetical protein NQ315_008173 [Exocentrus adspersus]|uniref:Regucalcin n=1 Tax=Exocentrus adspersus TaxID=1586481 RepID=A0AAV8VXU6_9CUCU|nr:hypothetical protein NQ315_008173 [Exocentrus adspersus]
MAPKIEKLNIGPLSLGEGPHWDVKTQSLYFVDFFERNINKYAPSTKKHTKAQIDNKSSIIIPVEGSEDQFVISSGRELVLISWDGKSDKVTMLKKLYEVDEGTENIFNDGKCDPTGRLWTGTMGPSGEDIEDIPEGRGSFYSFANGKITKHLSGIGISNGIAIDTNRNKFYYNDSYKGTLDEFDFDITKGTITNRKPLYTLFEKYSGNLELLDGMTIDTDGNLWAAVFNQSRVIKVDPRKPGAIADVIEFPTKQVTSVTFGGPNLVELYVTTGSVPLKGATPAPGDGDIYRVTEINAKGEGPHWDSKTQSLYFVDLIERNINKYVPSTKQHTKAQIDNNVSIIIPVKGSDDQFVISYGRELALISWDGKSDRVTILKKLAEVDEGTVNVFNDGKCDPTGRLWTGTMGSAVKDENIPEGKGSFYSLTNGKISKHLTGIGISNGIAIDTKTNKFYYNDSYKGSIDEFDFDITKGTITNRRPLYTLFEKYDGNLEVLDGMTIDTNGNLWAAVFNQSRVIKVDPRKPQTIADFVEIPTKQITSVTFGGPNLDELFVTTGRLPIKGVTPSAPGDGAVYRVTGINAKGLPGERIVL